ncbi:MAG: class I SAM-dependent methyltransferase, partial [Dehalococcoidia bacterium]
IGAELSPEILARERDKAERYGWTNITLIEGNAEEVDVPGPVDGVLCFYTHDIMNSPRAVERALGALRPGGRFVSAGMKRAKGVRGIPLNLYTLSYAWPFVTVKAMATLLRGTAVPWAYIESVMGHFDVQEHLGGSSYVGRGIKEASQDAASA